MLQMRQQMVTWGVSAQTWIRESAPGQSVSGVVCQRWMQEETMSQRCSTGFRIALMPSLSRSYWHTPGTWDLQQEELRPTAPESGLAVGLLPGKPLWAVDTASSCYESGKCNASQEGMKPPFSSLVGIVSPLHLWTVPLAKQHVKLYYCFLTGQAGAPEVWLTWTVMILCSLYFFVQYKRAQTCWIFSSWSCCWCSLFSFYLLCYWETVGTILGCCGATNI